MCILFDARLEQKVHERQKQKGQKHKKKVSRNNKIESFQEGAEILMEKLVRNFFFPWIIFITNEKEVSWICLLLNVWKVKKSPTDKVYPFLLPFQFSVFIFSCDLWQHNKVYFIFSVIKWNLFASHSIFVVVLACKLVWQFFYYVGILKNFLFFCFYGQKFSIGKTNWKLEITNVISIAFL